MTDTANSATPPSPCPACLDLNLEQFRSALSRQPSYSTKCVPVQELTSSADGGCQGCKILLLTAKPIIEEWHGRENVRIGMIVDTNRFDVQIWADYNYTHYFELNKFPGQDDDAATRWPLSLPVRTPISGYTGSDAAISKARSWLRTCLVEHGTSCSTNRPATLPTRVLRIDGPEQVALHLSNGEDESYICLSHFQSEVPWKDLPKTFRDAIHVTLQLGLRFLWIDSLCIIQDSAEDWQREGSMMANIYESALVTLAATKAPNANSGLFAHSEARLLSRVIQLDSQKMRTDDAVQAVHAREYIPHGMQNDRRTTPLLTRGWAFQERLLSRRTIHFADTEVGFECDTYQPCECSSEVSMISKIPGLLRFRSTQLSDPHIHTDIWYQMVNVYTQKLLTYSTDIFPALQGLAHRFSSGMGHYYAGHWETGLDFSLTWHRGQNLGLKSGSEPRPRPQTPANWRAPSWSWASIDGEVAFQQVFGRYPKAFVTILNVMTTPVGDDPMGQITSGALVLAGKCLLATLETYGEEGKRDHYCIQTMKLPTPGNDDFCLREPMGAQASATGTRQKQNNRVLFDYDIGIRGPYHIPRGSEVLLMKVDERLEEDHVNGNCNWLILRELNSEKHICERIGIIKLWRENKQTYTIDTLYNKEGVELEITII
ncbi:heterokaryon incompatibility protein-domain-containing protein [Phaeosphaeria sp. MPI-PUGE-AT-0046c]|nr:heterokaryon incompatibility protein-domain-containing protein [Phaeosphaeria sp. MPI-PUGE-AT-0046c]